MNPEKKKALVEFIGETIRLVERIVVVWAAVAEWGWLRGLGAAFALIGLREGRR